MHPIAYLPHAEIDQQKWDECVSNAANGLIYASSDYLNHLAPGWDALVLNDYEALFPLPWRKKWGLHYLFQPFLTAQLGLFGNDLSVELLNSFFKAIPNQFRYLDLPLNHGNIFYGSSFPLHQRMNYALSMQAPYSLLYNNYSQNIKRNIKKGLHAGCLIRKHIPLQPILSLAHQQLPNKNGYSQFEKLFHVLEQKNKTATFGVYSKNEQLLASAVFLFSNKRAYYILAGNHPNGRRQGASHLLIDAFIKEYAGTDLILDFEGSDLESLAFFYSGFGALKEPYPVLKLNRLPLLARWLKN